MVHDPTGQRIFDLAFRAMDPKGSHIRSLVEKLVAGPAAL
jgi:hypothetical protein